MAETVSIRRPTGLECKQHAQTEMGTKWGSGWGSSKKLSPHGQMRKTGPFVANVGAATLCHSSQAVAWSQTTS